MNYKPIRWMITSLVILFLCAMPVAAKSTIGPDYRDIDAGALKRMMDTEDPLVVFPLSRIEFNDLHIAGSVNIPLHDLAENLPADKTRKLVFYCLGTKCTASWRAADKAIELGYKNVYAFRKGLPAWVKAGYPTVSSAKLPEVDIVSIDTDELQSMLSRQDDFVLLDVCLKRDADKFWINSPNRIHIPFDQLESRLDEIPKDKKVAVICLKGKRSPTAIRYLTAQGFTRLISVEGGMQQWVLEGKPIVTN